MWQLLFWGSIAVVLYTYLGYPLLLTILAGFRRHRSAPRDPGEPTVCLVISAFNEEGVIRKKLENSLELRYPREKLRILVASDGSDDGTVPVVREYIEHGVRLIHHARRRGKSAMLNDVVASATEDILVFTDANSLLEPDAIARLVARFGDPETGCAVGKLRYVDADSTSVARGEGAYWKYEGLLSRMESRLRSVLVANGSIFAVRRSLVRELYPDVANDLQIPMDVASQGRGVVYEPAAIATEATAAYCSEEFGRKTRIVLRGLTGFFALRHRIRGMRLWQFVSHKLLRWTLGLFTAIAFVANAVLAASSGLYAVMFAVHLAFYAAALLGWMRRREGRTSRLLYIPFYFTMVNSAALVAIGRFVAGRRQSVWEKAQSTRSVGEVPGETAADRTAAGRGRKAGIKAEVIEN